MRRAATQLLILGLVTVGGRPLRAEHRYLEAKSSYQYAIATAPPPAVEFGIAGVNALAAVKTADDGAAAPALPPAARAWLGPAPAPFGPAVPKPTERITAIGGGHHGRVAALYLLGTFQVGEERERIKVLHLRAHFEDGLVASINGVEVVRRSIPGSSAPGSIAVRPHGPEWESFYIPVREGLLRAGDNQLTIEVRPSAARLVPTVDVELSGSEAAHVVRGPIVQRVRPGAATIVVETDIPTVTQVLYGLAASTYDRSAADGEARPTTHHELELVGLPGEAEIHYQVVAALAPGAPEERGVDHAFHTAPAAGDVVRFVVYGDVRSGHEAHARILRAVVDEAPDFVVTTGDMVLRGSDEADWQRFFALAGELLARTPMYPLAGNHDLGDGGSRRRFEDVFALPPRTPGEAGDATWYSFDVGGVHMIMLDFTRYEDARQLGWLERDLEAAEAAGARAIFVAGHQGPASRGPHGGDPVAARRYAPLLERHHALVFFSGHDHLYQRGTIGRLMYVVTGGGGAPLYQPRCGPKAKKPCGPDGARTVVAAHHYILVEVYRDYANLCARRPDGTPLEECVKLPL